MSMMNVENHLMKKKKKITKIKKKIKKKTKKKMKNKTNCTR